MIIETKTTGGVNMLIDFNGVFAVKSEIDNQNYSTFMFYGGLEYDIEIPYNESVRLLKLDRQQRGFETWNPDDKINAPEKAITEVGIHKFSLQKGTRSIIIEANFLINTQEFANAINGCSGVESFGINWGNKKEATENKYRETIYIGALFNLNDVCNNIVSAIANYINTFQFGIQK